MPRPQAIKAVDLFAGAGGASSGLVRACKKLGLKLDLVAINHWPTAIKTHSKNHPGVRHICESLETVNPLQVVPNGYLNLLLAGPECTHFSTARGGRAVDPQLRATAWCILKWAQEIYIDTIWIENVPEFKTWGPVGRNGKPLKSKKGETYKAFLNALRSLGYTVDDKILNSADYGAPTTRRRLFILAYRGRTPVSYPAPTHAKNPTPSLIEGDRANWTTARERVIDWSIKGKSIFNRPKPLRPATMLRIIAGLEKFGGVELKPFLALLRLNTTRMYLTEQILQSHKLLAATLFASPQIATILCFRYLHRCAALTSMFLPGHCNNTALEPFSPLTKAKAAPTLIPNFANANDPHENATLVAMEHGGRPVDPKTPVPTITTAKGGAFAVAEACLIHTTHGGRENNVDSPAPCITGAHRGELAIAQAYVLGQQSAAALRPDNQPIPTVATGGAIALVETTLEAKDESILVDASFGSFEPGDEERRAHSINEPLGVLPGSNRYGKVDATLVPMYNEREGQSPRCHNTDQPVPTIPATGNGKFAVAEAFIVPHRHQGQAEANPLVDSVNLPLRTLTAVNARCFGLAQPSLVKYYGTSETAQSVDKPIDTLTTKDRHALVEPYVIKTAHKGANGDYTYSTDQPVSTVTGKSEHALVESFISIQKNNSAPQSVDGPIPTLCTREHMALISPFVVPNNTNNQPQSVDSPIPTVTGANRLALVQPVINGLTLDIYFRMLQTHELARAMGFPDDYKFVGTKEQVVKQIGNAWSGELAEALCTAALQRYVKKGARQQNSKLKKAA